MPCRSVVDPLFFHQPPIPSQPDLPTGHAGNHAAHVSRVAQTFRSPVPPLPWSFSCRSSHRRIPCTLSRSQALFQRARFFSVMTSYTTHTCRLSACFVAHPTTSLPTNTVSRPPICAGQAVRRRARGLYARRDPLCQVHTSCTTWCIDRYMLTPSPQRKRLGHRPGCSGTPPNTQRAPLEHAAAAACRSQRHGQRTR